MTIHPFEPVDDRPEIKRGRGRPAGKHGGDPRNPSPDYALSEFYVRASDAKGHRDSYRVYLPQDMAAAATAVANACPAYEGNLGNLVRDAVFHRLVWWYENSDSAEVRDACEIALIEAQTQEQADQVDRWIRYLDGVESKLRTYSTAGDSAGMAMMLAGLERFVTRVRDPYRSRAQGIVDQYRRTQIRLAAIDPA